MRSRGSGTTEAVVVTFLLSVGSSIVATILLSPGSSTNALLLFGSATIAAALFFIAVRVTGVWRVRSAALRFHNEVSASAANDIFNNLLVFLLASPRRFARYQTFMQELAEKRPNPNSRVYALVAARLKPDRTPRSFRTTQAYLGRFIDAKRCAGLRVQRNVRRYLAAFDPARTYVLMTGYSRTIVNALRDSGISPGHVFVIREDQREKRLREHETAIHALSSLGLEPASCSIAAVDEICSSSNVTVRDDRDKEFTLGSGRQVIALVGCEAADATGNVVAPSERSGEMMETARLITRLHDAAVRATACAVSTIAVVEGLKVHATLPDEMRFVQAAAKGGIMRNLPYLLGVADLAWRDVALARLSATNITAIIDEFGVHQHVNAGIVLLEALDEWAESAMYA